MKLAISNIAWQVEEEKHILPLLAKYGIQGIEIAPTKYWPDMTFATRSEISGLKTRLNNAGFEIPAGQALLFGHPELVIFHDNETRKRTKEYLVKASILCSDLGIHNLVFGSPKNRQRGEVPYKSAFDIATDFFRQVAEKIASYDITLCIEPNPSEYGCDFILTANEALEIVKQVNHPHFQLHLDSSALFLNREDPTVIIPQCIPYLRHFHISEPFLGLIGETHNNHDLIANSLNENEYRGWISIEMRSGLSTENAVSIRRAIEYTKNVYIERFLNIS
jgi:D-psicose/D-tagatose/L-ribulose 3-epimerase